MSKDYFHGIFKSQHREICTMRTSDFVYYHHAWSARDMRTIRILASHRTLKLKNPAPLMSEAYFLHQFRTHSCVKLKPEG